MKRFISIVPFLLLGAGCLVDAQIQVDTGLTGIGTTGDDCTPGSWGCVCTDLQLCQAGLACQNGVCVDPADAWCGNGIIEAGEQCDDGPESPMCDGDCTWAECGDYWVNWSAGEQCDDGPMGSPWCDPMCFPIDCQNGGFCEPEDHPIVCEDGLDNDGDGLIDCDDADCINSGSCPLEPEDHPAVCSDGIDNDGDGFVDCQDFDCQGLMECFEPEDHPAVCTDGIDNDGDGFIDCQDFDCQGAGVCSVCGDDVQDAGEACDGTDLVGLDCVDFGFTGGTLACAPDCAGFDTSACM